MNRRIKKGWIAFKVTDIKTETHDTKTIFFEDADEGGRSFDFIPGQYLTFRIDHLTQKSIVRSYSLSSSPSQNFLAITVKKIDQGVVSTYFCEQLKIGDTLRARGAMGAFCYKPDPLRPNLVLLAAGSGVTPFISLMREGINEPIYALINYRTTNDLILWEDIKTLNQLENVDIQIALTREKAEGFLFGRINAQLLDSLYSEIYLKSIFMICGPKIFMEQLSKALMDRGVPSEAILMESFG